MSWRGAIQQGKRRLHVGATHDGRASIWEYIDGAPVVLARGRVRGMVELVGGEVVHGAPDDVATLARWLKSRLT
jgi:hypothetical protein